MLLFAEDENMSEAFHNDEDIHSRTAKEIYDLDSLDDVTAHRPPKSQKEVNFGIPYGVSAYRAGFYGWVSAMGEAEGRRLTQYFERFPGILGIHQMRPSSLPKSTAM
ncbi:MAG: DNA polymerase [Balneolaceae bacterium]|nr:DNA polymerase [Balneolaceae bacterium]